MSEARTIEKTEDIKVEDVKTETKTKAKKAKSEKKTTGARSVNEMRLELQKLVLDVKTGKEGNHSLVKKLRKEIARELTKLNTNK